MQAASYLYSLAHPESDTSISLGQEIEKMCNITFWPFDAIDTAVSVTSYQVSSVAPFHL